MSRYLVTGCSIVNDIEYADGRTIKKILGGSIYTHNGVKSYTDDVLFISAAGPDFLSFYGDYYSANGLPADGVEICLERTLYTLLKYEKDGQWQEHSIYGPENEWPAEAKINYQYVVKHGGPEVRGIYFESTSTETVWDHIGDIRKACPNAKIMAEVDTGEAMNPSCRESLLRMVGLTDIFSINKPEAMSLFGTKDEKDTIDAILELGKPCFFRVGVKGAYMLQDGRAYFAPSYLSEGCVDATGCGNCSTGASMYGFCEGFHPLKTVCYANVAAGINASHVGPYPHYSAELKERMIKAAENMYRELREEE